MLACCSQGGQCLVLNHECLKLFGCVAWVVAIRSSSCLAACVHSWWCRQDGCWHCVLAVVELWLRFLGSVWRGSSSVVKLLGGRGATVVVSSRRLVALCSLLVICDCVLLGLCMRGSSSVVKLLGGRGAIVVVSSRRLVALCILLLSCGCVFLGSVCGVRARSSSCLAAEVQSWWCCQDV